MSETVSPLSPIVIAGDLTIYAAAEWQEQLLRQSAGEGDICLDLSQTGEIDSAGVQLLLALQRQASGEGRRLRCTSPGAAVSAFLEFIGLTSVLGSGCDKAGTTEVEA